MAQIPGTSPVPFPRRPLDAHKHSVGTVLVVGGSPGMSGAAFLAGKAALRTGAGLVTVACPESVHQLLELKTTCVMTRGLPETDWGSLSEDALEPLLEASVGKSAIAVGPGLSRHPETIELVRRYMAALALEDNPPVVLDADGLNAYVGHVELLRELETPLVLTPHAGEFVRLDGGDKARLATDRHERLTTFVERVGAVTLLKGHRTLVGGAEGLYENETGNPGMATGGTGDVLTGVIAALLAAGLSPWDAARLGAWLHGRAGDLAARRVGWAPLIATDLLDTLIDAIRDLETRA
jgi:NAD(P)H-hydrate epimerase